MNDDEIINNDLLANGEGIHDIDPEMRVWLINLLKQARADERARISDELISIVDNKQGKWLQIEILEFIKRIEAIK